MGFGILEPMPATLRDTQVTSGHAGDIRIHSSAAIFGATRPGAFCGSVSAMADSDAWVKLSISVLAPAVVFSGGQVGVLSSLRAFIQVGPFHSLQVGHKCLRSNQ